MSGGTAPTRPGLRGMSAECVWLLTLAVRSVPGLTVGLVQVGRQQAGLSAEAGGGVLLAEGGVAVRFGVVGADLIAQDRLLLTWAEVPAGGLGGTDPGPGT